MVTGTREKGACGASDQISVRRSKLGKKAAVLHSGYSCEQCTLEIAKRIDNVMALEQGLCISRSLSPSSSCLITVYTYIKTLCTITIYVLDRLGEVNGDWVICLRPSL